MSKIKNNTGITSKDFYEDFTEEVEKGKNFNILERLKKQNFKSWSKLCKRIFILSIYK